MKYLIAGLGNIGEEFRHTRHNIGFDVLDALAARHGAVFEAERLGDVARLRFKGRQLLLLKPNTFMNLSGKALRYWLSQETISMERLLVVVDDLALPLEALRIRPSGSDAGHNGLKSIQELLASQNYARLRFGIGNQYPRGRQVDFVLGRWTPQELPLVEQKIQASVDIIETFVTEGVEACMNRFNSRKYSL